MLIFVALEAQSIEEKLWIVTVPLNVGINIVVCVEVRDGLFR